MDHLSRTIAATAAATALFIGVSACSSDNNKTSSSGSGGTSASSEVPTSFSTSALTNDFSQMKKLTSLASKGKGKVGVLLPETTTSARYVSFDAPYLKSAFAAAGVKSSDVIVTNAQGSTSTELTQAQ